MIASKSITGLTAILIGLFLVSSITTDTTALDTPPTAIDSGVQKLLDHPMGLRYTLPEGTYQKVNGEQLWCVNVEQRKTVMLMASEFHGLYDWRLKVHSILLAQQDIIRSYELKISSYEASLKIHQTDRAYYTARLDKEKDWSLNLEKSKGVEILTWKIISGLELAGILALSILQGVQAAQ